MIERIIDFFTGEPAPLIMGNAPDPKAAIAYRNIFTGAAEAETREPGTIARNLEIITTGVTPEMRQRAEKGGPAAQQLLALLERSEIDAPENYGDPY